MGGRTSHFIVKPNSNLTCPITTFEPNLEFLNLARTKSQIFEPSFNQTIASVEPTPINLKRVVLKPNLVDLQSFEPNSLDLTISDGLSPEFLIPIPLSVYCYRLQFKKCTLLERDGAQCHLL